MDKTRYIIRFNRKKRLDKHGLAPIQIECYLKGKRKFFDTKIKVTPTQWNEKYKEINLSHPNATKLNKHISEIVRDLETYELDRLNKSKPFHLAMLEDVFSNDSVRNFTDFMAMEIEKSTLTEQTKKNHRTTLGRLKEFKKIIHFEDLNFEFMHDFEIWAKKLTIKENGKPPRKLAHNTIWKYFKNIKTYVNLALDKDFLTVDQYPFRKFKFTQKEVEKTFLTPNEVQELESLKLENPKEQFIKDLFLFSIYTGLRYSDVVSLKTNDITDINGNKWIVKTMEKTDTVVRIPIHTLFNGKPLEIIFKHLNLGRAECFPYITNQYVNRELKKLIAKTNINKPITFHTARHTTATYLIFKRVNITTVQKILGHKKVSTTQIYGHIMDLTVENDIKAVNF